MDLRLDDQVVFVAGSSRGIGKAIAAALLTEGARVVLTGREEEALRTTHKELAQGKFAEKVMAIGGNFCDSRAISDGFRQAVDRFGRIDHLVANLGTGSGQTGWELGEEEWQRLFEINFFGSTRLTEAALPYLLGNAEGGSILYISSIVGLESTGAPLPYSAAKAALVNYSKNLARQLGPKKVRVNTIAPGNVFFAGGSWERHLETRRGAVEAMLENDVPLQRFGTPEEIASLAAYLCSSQAGFATGACYVMDGGQTRVV